MVDLGEVGLEQERDSFPRIGERARSDHDDEQEDEQRRHEDVAHLLDTFAHATYHNEVGKDDEYNGPDDRLYGIRGELLEILLYISRITIDVTHDGSEEVLKAPTCDDGVEAEDDK